jgi:conjugal transfer/type IV secretion protein DotA/TraY
LNKQKKYWNTHKLNHNQKASQSMKSKCNLLTALLALLPTAATAGVTGGILAPPETDVSIQALNSIFGLSGNNSNMISELMMIWNSAMLFVGAVLVGYILIAGVLKTAHEGEALGQKWNSMWIPLRASVGLLAIMPVLKGYCLIQLIVFWSAAQGIGLADMMWTKAVTMISKSGGFISAPAPNRDAFDVNARLYENIACQVGMNRDITAWAQAQGIDPKNRLIRPVTYGSTKDTSAGFGVRFGDVDGTHGDRVCGSFEWGVMDRVGANYEARTATGTNLVSMVSGVFGDMGDKVIEAQRKAIMKSYAILLPIAQNRILNGGDAPTSAQVLPAVQAYQEVMTESVKTMNQFIENQGLEGFAENAEKDGWAMAGSYYSRIGHFNQAAQDVIGSAPSGIVQDLPAPVYPFANTALQQAKADISALSDKLTPGAIKENAKLTGGGTPAAILHPFLFLQNSIIQGLNDGKDALVVQQNLGHTMLNTAIALFGVDVLANFMPAGKIAAARDVVNETMSKGGADGGLMKVIVIPLALAGAFLAYVLPMIPYVLMFLGVMSWLISVFIATVAAPLWAISHATPDGHDVFGQGASGYVLLMSVVLRPALMILAMIASMATLTAMNKILGLGFTTAFAGAQINSVTGLIGFITSILIYVVIVIVLCFGCFRLIHTVPDAILKWIGGSDDDAAGVEHQNTKALAYLSSTKQGITQATKHRGGRDGNDDGGGDGGDDSKNKDLSPGST